MAKRKVTDRVTAALTRESCENEQRARSNRKSVWYSRWERLATFLEGNPSKAQLLRRVNDFVDGVRGYHTKTNAFGAQDALEQLIKDKSLK